MSRLKILNRVIGADILKKHGVSGISVTNDKVARFVCSCGEVSNTDKCPKCGNEKFVPSNWNSYYKTEGVVWQEDGHHFPDEDPTIPEDSVCGRIALCGVSGNDIIIHEEWYPLITYASNGIHVNRNAGFAPEERLEMGRKVAGGEYSGIVDRAEEILHALDGKPGVPTLDFNHVNAAWGIASLEKSRYGSMKAFPLDEFRNLYPSTYFGSILTTSFLSRLNSSKEFPSTLAEAFSMCGVPSFLAEAARISGSANVFDYYGWRNSGTTEENASKLCIILKNVLAYAVSHNQLTVSEVTSRISDIVKAMGDDHEEQMRFAEFFIHNIQFSKKNIFDHYTEIKKDNPELVKPDIKASSILLTQKYMVKRGFSGERVDAFFDIFEKDPMAALTLLTEKKKLNEEEKALVANT